MTLLVFLEFALAMALGILLYMLVAYLYMLVAYLIGKVLRRKYAKQAKAQEAKLREYLDSLFGDIVDDSQPTP